MEIIISKLLSGLAIGGIYAILVTGLNLLTLVGGIFQFAYPHLVVFNMYVIWMAWIWTGGNLALTIIITIIAGLILNVATEPIFRPLSQRGSLLGSFVGAIGLATILSDVMGRLLNQGLTVSFPNELLASGTTIGTGIATLSMGQLATILGSVAGVVGLFFLIYRTRLGRAFRAMAQNPFVAWLLGIPIVRTSVASYIVAGLLGGAAAVFLAMYMGNVSVATASILSLKVFTVAIFAGNGNLKGGLIGAYVLGLFESFMIGIIPGDWSTAAFFAVVILVLMWKTDGLFGSRV